MGLGGGWRGGHLPPCLPLWGHPAPVSPHQLPCPHLTNPLLAELGMKSRVATLVFKATWPGFPLQHTSSRGLYSCHTKAQLSRFNLPIHASESLHAPAPLLGRLFPPGKFPLTLQGSVKSHLLQESFPDSPTSFRVFMSWVFAA